MKQFLNLAGGFLFVCLLVVACMGPRPKPNPTPKPDGNNATIVAPSGEQTIKPPVEAATSSDKRLDIIVAKTKEVQASLDKAPVPAQPFALTLKPPMQEILVNAIEAHQSNEQVLSLLNAVASSVNNVQTTQTTQIKELLAANASLKEDVTSRDKTIADRDAIIGGFAMKVWYAIAALGGFVLVVGVGLWVKVFLYPIPGQGIKQPLAVSGFGLALLALATVLPAILKTATEAVIVGIWVVVGAALLAFVGWCIHMFLEWRATHQRDEIIETVQRAVVKSDTGRPPPEFTAIAEAVMSPDTKAAINAFQEANGFGQAIKVPK